MNPLRQTTRLLLLGALATSAATDPATAQRTVWPAGYANTSGGSSQDLPFSIPAQASGARSVVLLTGSSLQSMANTTLSGMAFRRDGTHTGSYGGFTCQAEILLGPVESAARPSAALRDVFEAPPTRVTWGNLNVPAAPPTSGVAGFDLSIAFRVPYAYTGGDLGIDMVVRPATGTTLPTMWRRDAVWARSGPEAFSLLRGTSTPGNVSPPRYRLLAWTDTEQLHPGGRLETFAEQAPDVLGAPAVHHVGIATRQPLDLAGFPPGSFLQATGWIATTVATADRSQHWSRATLSLPIPADPTVAGARFATQWFVLDTTLPHALPFLCSQANDLRIGGAPRTGVRFGRTIWARGPGNYGAEFSARVGPPDYVPVIEFR